MYTDCKINHLEQSYSLFCRIRSYMWFNLNILMKLISVKDLSFVETLVWMKTPSMLNVHLLLAFIVVSVSLLHDRSASHQLSWLTFKLTVCNYAHLNSCFHTIVQNLKKKKIITIIMILESYYSDILLTVAYSFQTLFSYLQPL